MLIDCNVIKHRESLVQAGGLWPVCIEADVVILSLLGAVLLSRCCTNKVLQGPEQKAESSVPRLHDAQCANPNSGLCGSKIA